MQIKFDTSSFLKPSCISMVAVMMSFLAWVFPNFGVLRKGFNISETLDITSLVILILWYAMIYLSFRFGERCGEAVRSPSIISDERYSLNSKKIYIIYTFTSVLGTLYTFYRILSVISLKQAIIFIGLSQANALKYALYTDYSVGIVSLRYLTLFGTALAVYRVRKFKKIRFLDVCNFFNLLLVSFISTRLVFVATVLVSFFILNIDKTKFRINFGKIGLSFGVLFLVLSLFNYSRNANSYASDHLSFAGAGLSEILSYLGSPFQVAIGGAKILDKLVSGGEETYRSYVDVLDALNTNSAFIELHEKIGYWCWPYMASICFLLGCIFSMLSSSYKSIFLLPAGAILYGSAELWRVDLFKSGIFVTWVVMGISVPLLFSAWDISILGLRQYLSNINSAPSNRS